MEIAKIEEGQKMLEVKKSLKSKIEIIKTKLVDNKIQRITFTNEHGSFIFGVEKNKEFVIQTAELYLQILEGTLKELNLKIMAL